MRARQKHTQEFQIWKLLGNEWESWESCRSLAHARKRFAEAYHNKVGPQDFAIVRVECERLPVTHNASHPEEKAK